MTVTAYIDRNGCELTIAVEGSVSGRYGHIEEIIIERAWCACGSVLELTDAERRTCEAALLEQMEREDDAAREDAAEAAGDRGHS